MRLGDMNNLKAQALNEDMQKRVGWNFGDINRLSINQASAMLENVDTKLSAIKKTKKIHESEKDTVYNGLVMAKQVLESYIAERAVSKSQQQAAGAALAAKKGNAAKSKLKGASKAMAKMSTKELEKIAGTKHKGLPEKATAKKNESKPVNEISGDLAKRYTKRAKMDRDFNDDDLGRLSNKVRYGTDDQASQASDDMMKLQRRNSKRQTGINRAAKRITKESINESAEVRLDEAHSRAEKMVDESFIQIQNRLGSLAKIVRPGGNLSKMIDSIGGDSSDINSGTLEAAIEAAFDAAEDAHYGAMGHIMDESAAQGMFEDEVGQAETIMAAQDMVDSIQGMLEDVGQMINEKLPPLTDSIRRSNGAEAAATFNQQTNSALNALMDAVRTARESMATAVGTLSGEAPTAMTSVDTSVADQPEVDVGLGADEELDDFAASDAATGGVEALGRAKRA